MGMFFPTYFVLQVMEGHLVCHLVIKTLVQKFEPFGEKSPGDLKYKIA